MRGQYDERILFETSIINQMGFAGYFLIVADFINWAKNNGVPVGPGRGSGAGSLVAYSLGITDLDPIRFGLLFERFLNPERVSMPDFDIDFCQSRRDEVIDYVQKKYGTSTGFFPEFENASCYPKALSLLEKRLSLSKNLLQKIAFQNFQNYLKREIFL